LKELISSRPTRRPQCPQCGYEYQTKRNFPLLASSLLFQIGDTLFQAMGMSFVATSAVGLGAFGVMSVVAVGTGYGAIAVREYFGSPLFDLLLTDSPTNWSIGHHFFLFLTPLRLVSPLVNIGAFTPFFFLWPSLPPHSARTQLVAESQRIDADFPSLPITPKSSWPPSMRTFGCIMLGSSILYNRLFPPFAEWVLGMKRPRPRGFLQGISFRREVRRQERPDGVQEFEQEAIIQVGQEDNPEESDTPYGNLDGVTQYPNISLMIGLLKPFVASGMGHLLYLGAQHSRVLRLVLGIRHPIDTPILYSSPRFVPDLEDNVWYWRYFTETTVQQMDPVWIRNSVGLGIFIVVKDCVHLFHIWLTRRELASRRLKNRDFSGVDPKELDLIRPVGPTGTNEVPPA